MDPIANPFSPAYGELAFSVPLFGVYLLRTGRAVSS